MKSAAVVALALLESANAFQAPALKAARSVSKVSMFSEGDIGVLPPLGVYDPLGLIDTRDMFRYGARAISPPRPGPARRARPRFRPPTPPPPRPRAEVMEIKHGRAAMLGFLHVILIEAGVRFPTEQCEAAPAGLIASLEAMPTFAWLQIMLTTCMMESGYFLFEAQTTDAAPGDIGGDAWVRYDDPEAKTFKLNVERQNGRAAMLGVFGCILHELVGVDALYPTGGLGNGAPPTIF